MPLTLYDENGNYVWDTDTVAGGVIADIRTYDASASASLTYPTFAGRSVVVVNLLTWAEEDDIGVTTDTALGYPRVTVSALSNSAGNRRFAVLVI